MGRAAEASIVSKQWSFSPDSVTETRPSEKEQVLLSPAKTRERLRKATDVSRCCSGADRPELHAPIAGGTLALRSIDLLDWLARIMLKTWKCLPGAPPIRHVRVSLTSTMTYADIVGRGRLGIKRRSADYLAQNGCSYGRSHCESRHYRRARPSSKVTGPR